MTKKFKSIPSILLVFSFLFTANAQANSVQGSRMSVAGLGSVVMGSGYVLSGTNKLIVASIKSVGKGERLC